VSVHRINIKGPWEFEWIEPPDGGPAGRAKMPADWASLFGERAGAVRWTRRFHEPTGLEPGDRVWLAFAGIGGTARITLDDEPLGLVTDAENVRFEITDRLDLTNTLRVEITFDPANASGPGGLYGVLALEIESA
jgi:hypothetical protein